MRSLLLSGGDVSLGRLYILFILASRDLSSLLPSSSVRGRYLLNKGGGGGGGGTGAVIC